jgi:hypothetical protein
MTEQGLQEPDLPRHTVDRELFTSIARARGGARAVSVLRNGQLSKRVLQLTAVRRAVAGQTPGSEGWDVLAGTYDVLAALRQRSPDAWEQVLLRPYVDVCAAQCLRRLYGAAHGPADLRGLARLLDPVPAPEMTPHPVQVECDGVRLELGIADRGPYREVHGHPLAGPLDETELARWHAMLAAAWDVLVRRHPWHAEAIAAGLTTLVPLRPGPGGRVVSSAARRAFGSVAASLPGDPESLALTLVHEFLHTQLGALLDLVPLHGADSGARYAAPWRPDPRPAGALLQGAYAHLGVADFWRTEVLADSRAERGPRAGEEYLRWRDHTLGATRILLDCGELTEAGEEFTQELALTIESWGSGGFAQMSDELTTGVSRTY